MSNNSEKEPLKLSKEIEVDNNTPSIKNINIIPQDDEKQTNPLQNSSTNYYLSQSPDIYSQNLKTLTFIPSTTSSSQEDNQDPNNKKCSLNILGTLEISEPDYYSQEIFLDSCGYKVYDFLGIKFYRVGNVYLFGYNRYKNKAYFSIGAHLWIYLLFNLFLISVGIIFKLLLVKRFETWKQISVTIFFILFVSCYNFTILLNPGIITRNKRTFKDYLYCNKCYVYYNPENNVKHCDFCGVCVEQCDHHCNVYCKCIGKKNLLVFWGTMVMFSFWYMLTFIFTVILTVDYFMNRNQKIKGK